MKQSIFARWQANFWAGLVIVLPAVISLAVLRWLFGTVANITDLLLVFLPARLAHQDGGSGPMYWYWSVVALLFAALLIGIVGLLARYYFGRRVIEWVDAALMRVPLLNRIYSATKQVNDAFSSANKTAFRTVVLVRFPHGGMWSIGFITSEQQPEVEAKTGEKVVCVFVPATPNPTSGFLLMVPETQVIKLDLTVANAIKYIISLGAIQPEGAPLPGAAEAGPALPESGAGAGVP
ncbi:MAG: DUF502 domain-containing protein [Verrucomicrobia bacterium]|nr:DUF502 domain-containing protein [Verrucomicrobiota bacterium]HRY58702.1 DUF502 domain-containing protein [Candidatus Paceibacterota bacterium]HOW80108.1 DUF502 domain-containing protein [Verrucomicrobiota bacterium]HQE91100.1 DUF502 domain-containing protein [Verrucomicrobiota bacterium]HQH02358.1 DUF502 domain-containing protein [Verrucomicrobiota bacterium]